MSFEDIASIAALICAWRRVRANRGGAGGDRVTLDDFAAGLPRSLDRLAADLASGRYRPGPLRRVPIEKAGGGVRMLRIPCVRDRVAQTACNAELSRRFDREMSPLSFGYRPGRSVDMALLQVQRLSSSHPWVVDCDIEKFFDQAPHDLILRDFSRRVGDRRVRDLVMLWLDGFGPPKGLAQGAPISPLLANLHLDPFDRRMAQSGFPLIRYADDFVIMTRCEREAARAMKRAEAELGRRGLRLSARKSSIVRFGPDLAFLGHRFSRPAAGAGRVSPVGCFSPFNRVF